ncbi:hypothetical protein BU24DRAFT_416818 [Aaosphaeria arxii CBS 175.79]|uniref:histone acetyltransferase n=1 Tax=Aaosphaeria arxii CBS 175.79 TaxID=1450172 RepID=A0A6A5Y8T4_9PLEO|nr:uncharacterized protein BU24DRAFT_416818 [Aaosphaeria arxii CBS 175.79]KAF2021151.1 hypothetical protein BU24DRAFT_416818 [Aaosphaeria arxii CBS 175.79]
MVEISRNESLQEALTAALPKGVSFTFYHYSTPPTNSPALFSAPPQHKPERTYCESHFLAASITPAKSQTAVPSDELLVLAIEVLVYSTKALTTIFVSKADSTGYLTELNLPRSQGASPPKTICSTFVSWLARRRQRPGKKLVVSLFARAQDQYLFPASIDNPQKHVLDDRGLIKWWCKVLNPLLAEYAPEEDVKPLTERLKDVKDKASNNGGLRTEERATSKGYLVIPGYEEHETLRYVSSPSDRSSQRRWAASHPLLQIAPYPGAPPRCLVPHFPDDPKSRFLDELDEELPDARAEEMTQQGGTPSRSNGQWKSIKSLDQFWETMAYRQECSSGRIVGFIWVVIKQPKDSLKEEEGEDGEEGSSQSQSQYDSKPSSFSQPTNTTRGEHTSKPRRRKTNTNHGPIPLLIPRIKTNSSDLSSASIGSTGASRIPPESTAHFTWPANTRGTILFSATSYNRAHEIMLQQNFATRTAAARSTKRWKDEVAVLGGVDKWGWEVTGQHEAQTQASSTEGAAPTMILGVRKKRKPEPTTEEPSVHANTNSVQHLGESLVRKKPKVGDVTSSTESINSGANDINVLSAGLVRKKPKQ